MSNSCKLEITTSFKAPLWKWLDMLAGFGYVYRKTAIFEDGEGVAIDITLDGFTLPIYNSVGTLIVTLGIGTGLVKVATNKLNILLGPPVTNAAGTYTGVLNWTRAATGEVIPILNFSFTLS